MGIDKIQLGFVHGSDTGVILAVAKEPGQLSAFVLTMVLCQHPWLEGLRALVKVGRCFSSTLAYGQLVCLSEDAAGVVIRDWCQSRDWMETPHLISNGDEGPLEAAV